MSRKIYLIHLLDDYSGSPKILSQMGTIVNKCEHEVIALVGSSSKGFIHESGIKKVSFFYRRFNNKLLLLISYLLSQLVLFFTLSNQLIKNRIMGDKATVVVNTILPFGAALSARLFADSVIYYSHEVSIRPRVLNTFLVFICNMVADKVIFVSNYLKEEISLSKNIVQHTIYNPVSTKFEAYTPTQNELRCKWMRKNVVMACSLKDYKGIPEFIGLAKEAYSQGLGLHFTIAINDTEKEIARYFALFEGYQKYVEVLARPDNLPSIFSNAFLVVNLSCQKGWVETFGLTLVEGMASYCPVVGPVVGGPKEIVVHGQSGYLFDSKDPELLSAINKLAEDYELWEFMSKNAKRRSLDFGEKQYEKNVLDALGLYHDDHNQY